jgi:hypothetical protein
LCHHLHHQQQHCYSASSFIFTLNFCSNLEEETQANLEENQANPEAASNQMMMVLPASRLHNNFQFRDFLAFFFAGLQQHPKQNL